MRCFLHNSTYVDYWSYRLLLLAHVVSLYYV
nr:MAG TPA: hypothetical protein [Caudoviricetes sp.]